MKRILCMLSLLLVAMGAGAQAPGEGGALAPGIKYRVGVGSRVTQNYSVLTESLDFGVGYRPDGQNVFGVVGQICQDAVQVTQGVFTGSLLLPCSLYSASWNHSGTDTDTQAALRSSILQQSSIWKRI